METERQQAANSTWKQKRKFHRLTMSYEEIDEENVGGDKQEIIRSIT